MDFWTALVAFNAIKDLDATLEQRRDFMEVLRASLPPSMVAAWVKTFQDMIDNYGGSRTKDTGDGPHRPDSDGMVREASPAPKKRGRPPKVR